MMIDLISSMMEVVVWLVLVTLMMVALLMILVVMMLHRWSLVALVLVLVVLILVLVLVQVLVLVGMVGMKMLGFEWREVLRRWSRLVIIWS